MGQDDDKDKEGRRATRTKMQTRTKNNTTRTKGQTFPLHDDLHALHFGCTSGDRLLLRG